jgi:hypothetical protein
MPAQKRKLSKNYIGILCDQAEDQLAIESLPKSDRLMKDCVLALMAVVRGCYRNINWSASPAPDCGPVTIRNYAAPEAAAIPRSDP